MSLANGARIGPYEIVSAIGAGGMGEVYRARDLHLNREVAIKILPDTFAADPERVARFKREAQVVASLNHPNIAAIYGFEEGSALVLELVEGPTLADRIAQGPIPLDEALAIASQIADALEAAHERGIIHRDLKPANIKLREDGTVKVLDFGLAKALESEHASPDISMSPTMSIAATRMGVILGTAAYMAPEQARGKAVDRRADIWAFGCVLYEMVTGKRAFEGEEVSDTLAAILRGEPDWSRVPASLHRLLRACLEKDRKKRLQSIGDYRLLLDDAAVQTRSGKRPLIWMVSTAAFAVAALAIGLVHFRETAATEPVRRVSIAVPEDALIGFAAISPDGNQLVAALPTEAGSQFQLWRRSLESTQLQPLSNTTSARAPFWSPDGRNIGFFADGKLKIIPSGGGPVQALCDAGLGAGGTWNSEGLILFGNGGSRSIDRVQASGGACAPVLKGTDTGYNNPVFLPDGRHFLYQVGGQGNASGLYVGAIDGGPGIRLLPDRSSGIFAVSRAAGTRGYLLFLRDNRLMAQSFDSSTLTLGGDPMVIAEDGSFTLNAGQLAASADNRGTLLYQAQRPRRYQLTWFDRLGKELGKIDIAQDERDVVFSPDERSVASVRPGSAGAFEVWVRDLSRDIEALFATGTAPVWAPDGVNIAFSSRNGLQVKDTGGGEPKALLQSDTQKSPSDWSRDGRTLVYTDTDPKTRGDIWLLLNPLADGDRKSVPFLRTDANESQGRISPDGRWIAYASDESGRNEIYVRPFPSGPGKWRISNNSGTEPSWRRDSSELFYLELEGAGARRRVVAVPTRGGPAQRFEAGVPKPLFDFPQTGFVIGANMFVYSPIKDGSRFLAAVQSADSRPTLNLITNWEQLLTNAK